MHFVERSPAMVNASVREGIEMSRRKQGYLFLAFALVALMSNASIFVYWGIPAHGVESLKTYTEFTWIRYSITTLWGLA